MGEDMIKPGDGTMGVEFNVPPEGLHEFEFSDHERVVCGENKDCLRFNLSYVDDETARTSIFIKWMDDRSLVKFVDMIIASNVWPKMMKKGYVKSDIANGAKKAMLQDEGFQTKLASELEGCRIMCEIKHSKGKGEFKDRVNANVMKVQSAGKAKSPAQSIAGGVKQEVGSLDFDASEPAVPSKPAADDQSDW